MKAVVRTLFGRNDLTLMMVLLVFSLDALAARHYESIEWELPSTRFSDLGLDPSKIAQIAQGGQFVIVSNPQDFSFWNARNKKPQQFTGQRITYVASVIDAPVEEVRQMTWDIESQGEFSPLLNNTALISTSGNTRIGSYEQEIKVPIIKLVSDFIVQLNKYENGDIGMVLIDEGDIESMYQYWEFFPLDENRTLTVLSGWQDTESASFMYSVLLEAEPALGKVFPVLTMWERVVQFRNEAKKRHPELASKANNVIYDIRSINGFVSDNEAVDIRELKKLTQLGSVLLFQTPRELSHEGEMEEVIQVSAVQYIPLPKAPIQPLLNNFSSLAEYNELTDDWLNTDITEEIWGHLKISAKIGPIKVPVEIYVTLEDMDENKLIFYTAEHSFMHPLFGHLEYLEIPDETDAGTIVELTIGGVVGPKASFIFKMTRYLPFHNVLIAAAYTMLTADNMEDWVVARVASDELNRSQETVVDSF